MATKSGPPIGPFPEGVESDEQKEEYDKLRRRVLWKMPYGLYVVGARDGERRNGMTLNWASMSRQRLHNGFPSTTGGPELRSSTRPSPT
jgi:hypothetical protein